MPIAAELVDAELDTNSNGCQLNSTAGAIPSRG